MIYLGKCVSEYMSSPSIISEWIFCTYDSFRFPRTERFFLQNKPSSLEKRWIPKNTIFCNIHILFKKLYLHTIRCCTVTVPFWTCSALLCNILKTVQNVYDWNLLYFSKLKLFWCEMDESRSSSTFAVIKIAFFENFGA